MALHAAAFGWPAAPEELDLSPSRFLGKAVYYARRSFRFPKSGPWDEDLHASVVPFADEDVGQPPNLVAIQARQSRGRFVGEQRGALDLGRCRF